MFVLINEQCSEFNQSLIPSPLCCNHRLYSYIHPFIKSLKGFLCLSGIKPPSIYNIDQPPSTCILEIEQKIKQVLQ